MRYLNDLISSSIIISGFVTLVWLPSGISLAALLIFGYHLWPGIFVGAFLANYLNEAPFMVAIGIAVGYMLEALGGAYVLKRFRNFKNYLSRLRDVVALILVPFQGGVDGRQQKVVQ